MLDGRQMAHRPSVRKASQGSPKAPKARRRVASGLDGKGFEQTIEELSASFVRVPVAEIGTEIDRWIREVAIGLGLDRGALAQIDPKTRKLTVRHSWSQGNLVKLPVGMELGRSAPWFDVVLMNGQTVVFSRVSELPPEFSQDLKTFRHYVPKSNITVPVRMGAEVVGALGFATVRKERPWSPRLVRRIELVAQIFVHALERRYAAEEIGLLRDELNHVSRLSAMGELSASLTHQLNQPIAAILSNAEAIQSMLESPQPDVDELRSAVGDIIQDDLRATDVIKGLRGFFRKRVVEKSPIYLREIVADVLRMVRSAALFRNISLEFEAPPERIPIVADRVQLQQTILNLVLNAFDAVSENGRERRVSIITDVEGSQVRLSVRDTGKGIDPATIAHIFEPFFTTKPQGMGMGLAIARSIVEAHGGQLSARRNDDRGSTFEIFLPVSPQPERQHKSLDQNGR